MRQSKNLIFGIHPVAEAINAGREFSKIFLKKGSKGESFRQLEALIRECNIPFQYVPVEKLNRLSSKNHQGVIAELSLIEYKQIEEIVQRTFEEGRDPFIVILDRITDVRNFGAIARTAECAGADAILIPERGAASITSEALKTSAGALNRIAVCRTANLNQSVTFLKESGISIIAASEKSSEYHFSATLTGPVGLIMGSEEDGISKTLINSAETLVKIPITTDFDSLNVSVAFGIIAFEVVRQRLIQKP